ncbi:hypothetical protein GALMADRAFT_264902 [Galerina marginata CBS 339.88]|uniref:Uncharacterized protein n=1 Tax=Galerina marginata (strain CBS 339.88) TaxID=685588 RepID=A0A067TCW9_GALM3|nr:hypothetical protein GALMADRAFT_264902 [Galerina marginata CBS 339.88]
MDKAEVIIANLYACGVTKDFAKQFVANATTDELIEATTNPDWALCSYWGTNLPLTLTRGLGGTGAEYRTALEAMGFRPEHINWIDKDANMFRLHTVMISLVQENATRIWDTKKSMEAQETNT